MGALYAVRVQRDAANHVIGFAGTATQVATAQYLDGGLDYGPQDVLFLTTYPGNQVLQLRPGSTQPDRAIGLTALGVQSSVGTLAFVPQGMNGAGELQIASYSTGAFYQGTVQPDGNGTLDIVGLQQVATLPGGPEGITHVPAGSPLFAANTMLVAEYGNSRVSAYQMNPSGWPLPATRQDFVTNLGGAEGATIDPATGDFLFSSFGGRILVVRGFTSPCASFVSYGQGLPGTGGLLPVLGGHGCAARNLTISFDVSNGLGGTPGVLVIGAQQRAIPVLGGTLLVDPVLMVPHVLGGTPNVAGAGFAGIPSRIPDDANLVGVDFYTQAFYLDLAAVQQIAMTAGLTSQIR